MIYTLDTNIFSYLLKKDAKIKRQMEKAIENEFEFVILPIVYYEITRWLMERNAINLQAEFKIMCDEMPLAETNKAIWDKAAELYVATRKIGKPIGNDADLLIAAFCITNSYILITNNTQHFENIDGLKFINWK